MMLIIDKGENIIIYSPAQAALCPGVADSDVKNDEAGFFAVLAGVSSAVWSHLPRLLGAADWSILLKLTVIG